MLFADVTDLAGRVSSAFDVASFLERLGVSAVTVGILWLMLRGEQKERKALADRVESLFRDSATHVNNLSDRYINDVKASRAEVNVLVERLLQIGERKAEGLQRLAEAMARPRS
jgi:hypothetical protein